MRTQKLESTDGFVLVDLEEAEHAVGIVRVAPKILVDGATWLARSATYQWASFGRKVSGASAGVNARGDARDAAVAAFVEEVRPLVAEGRFLPSAGKGLRPDELAPLADVDPRGPLVPSHADTLTSVTVASAVASVAPAAGGLRVALEGLDVAGLDGAGLVASLADRGATIVAVATAGGAAVDPAGLDAAAVTAWLAGEAPAPDGQGATAADVLAAAADVLVAGSKAGVVDHVVADAVSARAIVPCGPVPVTAKALAQLRRQGVVVLPDFVTTAGPVFGSWPADGVGLGEAAAEASDAVRDVLGEVAEHPDGPLLGAAKRAEAFLATWVAQMPFGRPIA